MEAWLGLIGALAGAAIGGYVTYRVTSLQYVKQRQRENDARLLSACESIHNLLSKISSQASVLNMGVIGDLGYSSPLKGDILEEKVELDRLRMLVDFYAPSIQNDVKNISDNFAVITKVIAEVLLKKERGNEWVTKSVGDAAIAAMEISKQAQTAQQSLAVIVRESLAKS